MYEADSPHRITHVHMLATVVIVLKYHFTPLYTTSTNLLLCLKYLNLSFPHLILLASKVLCALCCASDEHRECLKPRGRKGRPLGLEDPKNRK